MLFYSCNSSVMYGPPCGIWFHFSLDVVAAAFVTCIIMEKKTKNKTQSPTDKPSMMTSQTANNISQIERVA